MNNKERYLKFIKDFNNIKIRKIGEKLNIDLAGFYTYRLSLENMQRVTNEMRKQVKDVYPAVNDNEFILDTKEKNIAYVKDIMEISINNICINLQIFKQNIYSLQSSESKYELVINEIKKELDDVYDKYNKEYIE